jgi:hypothetical protein
MPLADPRSKYGLNRFKYGLNRYSLLVEQPNLRFQQEVAMPSADKVAIVPSRLP